MYYSNRGACECTSDSASGGGLTVHGGYMNMKPPKFELIIEDCDKAISLNKDYVKAINRRANALEALDRLEEALRGRLTPFFALSRLTFFREPRLHRCHDSGRIPEREGCSGGGTRIKETLCDESRRNHQGSHLLPLRPTRANRFHRPVTHTSPRIPSSLRTSLRSVFALYPRYQKTHRSRIIH